MRNLLLLALVLLLAASIANAQTIDRVGLYAVPNPTSVDDCNIPDTAPGLLPIYCVHLQVPAGGPQMIACQFQAKIPDCFTGSWLSDTAVYPVTVNNSQVGVAIGYGVALACPIHVLTINVFAQGTTPACCVFSVTADPNIESGRLEFVDADNQLLYGEGQSGVINGTVDCACGDIVPAKSASWSKIKALYQ